MKWHSGTGSRRQELSSKSSPQTEAEAEAGLVSKHWIAEVDPVRCSTYDIARRTDMLLN